MATRFYNRPVPLSPTAPAAPARRPARLARPRTVLEQTLATDVLGLLDARAEHFADRVALAIREDGRWREWTFGELSARAKACAAALRADGVVPGDRVALLAEARPEWAAAFFGIVRAGATCVPLDPKATEAELAACVADAAPRVLLASDACADVARRLAGAGGPRVHALQALPDAAPPVASCPRRLDEVAVLVYTSGTTGAPKGVEITFQTLVFQVKSFERRVEVGPGDRFVSILPLNHLLELTGGLLGVLHGGGTVSYAGSLFPEDIAAALRERRGTAMIVVPLFLRSLAAAIEREARRGPWWRRAAWHVAHAIAPALPRGVRRRLFGAVHRALGGGLRAFVCGGAPLDARLGRFFARLGVPVLEGYGLTETGPVVAVNTLAANRPGSVGRPLEGVEVRIGADDEVLTRGPHVMRGYHGHPEATRAVIDADGWLRTGDRGRLDADGFLWITGRLKRLIVLGGGKKVQPEEIEGALARGTAWSEACVLPRVARDGLAAGSEEVCAVVVPADALRARLPAEADAVRATIADEIARCTRDLAPWKRPTAIVLHPNELPKTPARKVRLPAVAAWLAARVGA